jgi:hypothetical protein
VLKPKDLPAGFLVEIFFVIYQLGFEYDSRKGAKALSSKDNSFTFAPWRLGGRYSELIFAPFAYFAAIPLVPQ